MVTASFFPNQDDSMNVYSLFNISGRTALVTGGNSGIGAAMARALGLGGAKIILVARREAELREAAAGLRGQGVEAEYLVRDLSEARDAEDCGKEALARHGRVDILVNAAGVNLRQPFMDVTPETWRRQLDVHLTGPFFLSRALLPVMAENRWGRVINVASLQSFRAFADSAPYGAAKGGVVQLTRAMAREWSPRGITCNAVAPGFFPTPLAEPVFSDAALLAEHAAKTCVGRNGIMEDLYGCTIFLASDASAYITGQTLMLDGGYSAK